MRRGGLNVLPPGQNMAPNRRRRSAWPRRGFLRLRDGPTASQATKGDLRVALADVAGLFKRLGREHLAIRGRENAHSALAQ
jgi:hypothetical protein